MTAAQSAYRWGDDDGNAGAHSFAAAENINLDRAIRTAMRLRIQQANTGAFSGGTTQPGINYKKTTETVWKRPIAESGSDSVVSFGAAGVADTATASPVVPNRPSFTPGTQGNASALLLVIWQKPATANGGTVTTPSGWNLIGSATGGGYGATLGADTGNTNIFLYWKVPDGTEATTLSVTVGDTSVVAAQIFRIDSSIADGDWSFALVSGSDATGDGTFTVTGASDPGFIVGDLVFGVACIATDLNASPFSAQAFAATGVTFGAVTEDADTQTSSGNDMGRMIAHAQITAGPSAGNPTFSATYTGTATNARGPGAILRCRHTKNQRMVLKLSASIGAADSTAARLSVPGGKTFDTGLATDTNDEQAATSVGTDRYTEWEWNLEATENAIVGDIYEFRVTDDQSPFDTYTVTPQMTIAAVASGVQEQAQSQVFL